MILTAREVLKAIEEFDQRLWDEDHELYDEDEGEDKTFTRLYDGDERVEVPGLGVLVRVDTLEGYDETRTMTVVFTIEGSNRFFSMEGWFDSWGGEEGWEGPFKEVKQVEVLRKEWQAV